MFNKKEEVILEDGTVLHIDNGMLFHVTHNDGDGVGCAVVSRMMLDTVVNAWDFKFCKIGTQDDVVNAALDKWEKTRVYPAFFFVTDLSLSHETCERIRTIRDAINKVVGDGPYEVREHVDNDEDGELEDNSLVWRFIDHHMTNEEDLFHVVSDKVVPKWDATSYATANYIDYMDTDGIDMVNLQMHSGGITEYDVFVEELMDFDFLTEHPYTSFDVSEQPVSATYLLFEELMSPFGLYSLRLGAEELTVTKALVQFVYGIDRYDTWVWKTSPAENQYGTFFEDMYSMYTFEVGPQAAFDDFVEVVLNDDTTVAMKIAHIVYNKRRKAQSFALSMAKKCHLTNVCGFSAAVSILSGDPSEFTAVAKSVFDGVDITVLFNPSSGTANIRSINPEVNCATVAKLLAQATGASSHGGYPGASGCTYDDTEKFWEAMGRYYYKNQYSLPLPKEALAAKYVEKLHDIVAAMNADYSSLPTADDQ